MMKYIPTAIASLLGALALSGAAFAANEVHPAPTEKGYTSHPDHKASAPKSREQVKAELAAAKKTGDAGRIGRGLPVADPKAGPSKTRTEVAAEVKKETPEQKRKRMAEMKN